MASDIPQPTGGSVPIIPTSIPPTSRDKKEKDAEAFQDFLNSPPVSPLRTEPPVPPLDPPKVQPEVPLKNPTDFDPSKSAFHKSLFVLGAGGPSTVPGVRPLSPVTTTADAPPSVDASPSVEEVPSVQTSGTSFLDPFIFFVFCCFVDLKFKF